VRARCTGSPAFKCIVDVMNHRIFPAPRCLLQRRDTACTAVRAEKMRCDEPRHMGPPVGERRTRNSSKREHVGDDRNGKIARTGRQTFNRRNCRDLVFSVGATKQIQQRWQGTSGRFSNAPECHRSYGSPAWIRMLEEPYERGQRLRLALPKDLDDLVECSAAGAQASKSRHQLFVLLDRQSASLRPAYCNR
jgi:hypothetical protein